MQLTIQLILLRHLVGLDKTEIYLIYSRNEESRTAVKIMADNGFQNVYRLQGNYGAWVDAGFPVSHWE